MVSSACHANKVRLSSEQHSGTESQVRPWIHYCFHIVWPHGHQCRCSPQGSAGTEIRLLSLSGASYPRYGQCRAYRVSELSSNLISSPELTTRLSCHSFFFLLAMPQL